MKQKKEVLILALKFSLKAPKITLNLAQLTRAFASQFAQEVAEPEMQRQKLLMIERAQANKRANGGAIKASYSESYLEASISGRAKGAGGVRKVSTTPNLTVTGEFLGSIQVGQIKAGAKAFFSGAHATSSGRSLRNSELAGYLFGMGFDGWFDFSDEDKTRINKAFNAFLNRHTKDLVTLT